MSFSGPTQLWRNFFSHATMNYNIKQVLIETVGEDDNRFLFASATPAGIKHTWAVTWGYGFDITENIEAVINTANMKDSLQVMKSNKSYQASLDGNKCNIIGIDVKHRTQVKMGSVSKHKNEKKYYVEMKPYGKRYQIQVASHSTGIPIPLTAPVEGEKQTQWQQFLGVDASILKAKLKDAKTIGAKTITIATNPEDGNELVFTSISDRPNSPIQDQEAVSVDYGTVVHKWSQTFTIDRLEPILSLAENMVYLAMTDQTVNKKNPGLWIAMMHVHDTKPQLIAGYLLMTMKERKKK